MASVVVIGAGISGLAAAHALRQGGHDVTVLEQRWAAGGRIHSERVAGFLMEHGPNTMSTPAAAADALIAELGLAGEQVVRGENARRRYLVRAGVAHGLPGRPLRFFLSDFFSFGGRLRMLAEPFVAPEDGDETLAAFARRRFGEEFLDYVMDPLAAGLYAGEPAQLSISATLPAIKALERRAGSVLGGLLKAHLMRTGKALPLCPRTLFSFRDGLAALPRALAARLTTSLRLGCQVEAVEPAAGCGYRIRVRRGVDGQALKADAVVLALPAYAATRILAPLDPVAAEALSTLAHPPLAVVFLGYPAAAIPHPLDGVGTLIPGVENRDVLAILFSSTLFAGRAPPNHIALTAFVGGARRPELATLAASDLEALVDSEVRDLFGSRAAPCLARVRYWRRGLPQPDLAHAERLRKLRAFETEHPGLAVTGNYLSGVSTAACIDAALAAAGRIGSHLSLCRPTRVADAAQRPIRRSGS